MFDFDFAKRVIAWLTAVALPVQGLAVATMEARGPAHYHASTQSMERSHAGHAHEHVEHHHHAPGEDAIEVDDDHQHQTLAVEESGSKRGSSGGFDTLITGPLAFPVDSRASAIAIGNAKKPPPRFLGRLERPPKTSAVRIST